MEEKTFFEYDGVKVTNARFIVDSQTFAMSNITSVKASRVDGSMTGPVILITLGFLVLLGSISAGNWFAALIAIVVGCLGVLWAKSTKSMYHIMLTTAGGETSALSSRQPEYVKKVTQALNDAIVARG